MISKYIGKMIFICFSFKSRYNIIGMFLKEYYFLDL